MTDAAGAGWPSGSTRWRCLRPRRRVVQATTTVVTTVLFTDLVASTETAADLGDEHWGEVLARHHALIRQQLDLFDGREVKTTGDGFLAVFDDPAQAVECAAAPPVDRAGPWPGAQGRAPHRPLRTLRR